MECSCFHEKKTISQQQQKGQKEKTGCVASAKALSIVLQGLQRWGKGKMKLTRFLLISATSQFYCLQCQFHFQGKGVALNYFCRSEGGNVFNVFQCQFQLLAVFATDLRQNVAHYHQVCNECSLHHQSGVQINPFAGKVKFKKPVLISALRWNLFRLPEVTGKYCQHLSLAHALKLKQVLFKRYVFYSADSMRQTIGRNPTNS